MNRQTRIDKLEQVVSELEKIGLNYCDKFPAHFMVSHAIGFISSLITLESDPSEHSQLMMGVVTRDDDVHRKLKIEDGKVITIE